MFQDTQLVALRPFSCPDAAELLISKMRELSGQVLIVGHRNADPDALGSALALAHLTSETNPSLTVQIAFQECSRLTETIFKKFTPEELPWRVSFDYEFGEESVTLGQHVVLVDTTIPQMAGLRSSVTATLRDAGFLVGAVDHHSPTQSVQSLSFCICEPSFVSTCEIMTALLTREKIPVSSALANLLLAGIVFDSRRFELADKWVLSAAAILSAQGGSLRQILSAFSRKPDASERMARLKAAQRLRILPIGPFHLLLSRVSSFEASAARGIAQLGGDVVMVTAKKRKEVRASIRANVDFLDETGLDLGRDLADPVGTSLGGWGGGHAAAAGISVPSDTPSRHLEETAINQLRNLLVSRGKG